MERYFLNWVCYSNWIILTYLVPSLVSHYKFGFCIILFFSAYPNPAKIGCICHKHALNTSSSTAKISSLSPSNAASNILVLLFASSFLFLLSSSSFFLSFSASSLSIWTSFSHAYIMHDKENIIMSMVVPHSTFKNFICFCGLLNKISIIKSE